MVFFFNDTATTEIYTLSLHDALPISWRPPSADAERYRPLRRGGWTVSRSGSGRCSAWSARACPTPRRSEEHTSELQSRQYLVCRLLLEKKKEKQISHIHSARLE